MGRKVHPYGFRLGVIRDWKSCWYAEGEDYVELLHEDLEIRQFIRENVGHAGISRETAPGLDSFLTPRRPRLLGYVSHIRDARSLIWRTWVR